MLHLVFGCELAAVLVIQTLIYEFHGLTRLSLACKSVQHSVGSVAQLFHLLFLVLIIKEPLVLRPEYLLFVLLYLDPIKCVLAHTLHPCFVLHAIVITLVALITDDTLCVLRIV
jgi:hypothetical protein